jgi:(S)-ureidoglycine-glyoxylate aminotransferase
MNPTPELFNDLDPSPRLLMGPGPVDVYPRVLRAMSTPMLGQFDPEFTAYMNETMALYRQVYRTANEWTFLVNGTARAGIEACLGSMVSPGDKVLVPIFGRFGHLLAEICRRVGGEIVTMNEDWGSVFDLDRIADAIKEHRPRVVAMVHGDTSTTTVQPLAGLGAVCREQDALLYVDATATLGGMPVNVGEWQLDAVSAGLQKCLSGPPGSSPITIGERTVEAVLKRKHIEGGIRPEGYVDSDGPAISSNYLDPGTPWPAAPCATACSPWGSNCLVMKRTAW